MIIIIGHDASLSGAPKFLLNFCRWINTNTDLELFIILRNGGPLQTAYEEVAKTVIWNRKFHKRSMTRRIFYRIIKRSMIDEWHDKILDKLKKRNPRIIFNNTCTNGSIIQSLQSLNVPVVTRIPELAYSLDYYNQNGTVDLTLSLSNLLIAVSGSVKTTLIEKYGLDPERVSTSYGKIPPISNGFEKSKLRTECKIPKTALVVGGSGSLSWRKGIDVFFNIASNYLKEKDHDVYFVWVGGKEDSVQYNQLMHDVQKMHLGSQFIILTYTDRPSEYYLDFDVFLMTSREDPFPLVNLEVGQLAKPIIAFKNSGGTEELLDEDCGILVDYLDQVGMKNELIDLLGNKNRRTELGNRLKSKVDQGFTIRNDRNEIFDILKRTYEVA